jgi:hypothetical protein
MVRLMPKRLCVGILSVGFLGAPAVAQTPVPARLDSGTLVRLRLLDGSLVHGRLVRSFAADSQRVVVCPYRRPPCERVTEPAVRTVQTDLIKQLDIARGTRAGRGAAIGAGAGIVIALVMGPVIDGLSEQPRSDHGMLVLSGALGGAVWGAVIGSTVVVWAPPP